MNKADNKSVLVKSKTNVISNNAKEQGKNNVYTINSATMNCLKPQLKFIFVN